MSPLLDLQQRSVEIGRIRIGAQVKARNGGMRPSKLDAFRFTTNSPRAAQSVADLFGGEVRTWVGGSQTYEIYTTATEMDVMVPPGDLALSQHYELWSGGGCQRRCDSRVEQITGGPCLCPPDIAERMAAAANGEACKPTTRVSVILPDLPGLGVWRHESKGYNAAHELGGTADFLARAREAGQIIPATMRLEQRETKTGKETHRFAVVVLDVGATLRQLVEGSVGGTVQQALPPAPNGVKAIEAPKPPAGPVVLGEGSTVPAGSSAKQIALEVLACTDVKALEQIAGRVKREGLHTELVPDAEGIFDTLWNLILARRDQIGGS